MNSQDIENSSVLEIFNKQLYDPTHMQTMSYGLLDSRLGISESFKLC